MTLHDNFTTTAQSQDNWPQLIASVPATGNYQPLFLNTIRTLTKPERRKSLYMPEARRDSLDDKTKINAFRMLLRVRGDPDNYSEKNHDTALQSGALHCCELDPWTFAGFVIFSNLRYNFEEMTRHVKIKSIVAACLLIAAHNAHSTPTTLHDTTAPAVAATSTTAQLPIKPIAPDTRSTSPASNHLSESTNVLTVDAPDTIPKVVYYNNAISILGVSKELIRTLNEGCDKLFASQTSDTETITVGNFSVEFEDDSYIIKHQKNFVATLYPDLLAINDYSSKFIVKICDSFCPSYFQEWPAKRLDKIAENNHERRLRFESWMQNPDGFSSEYIAKTTEHNTRSDLLISEYKKSVEGKKWSPELTKLTPTLQSQLPIAELEELLTELAKTLPQENPRLSKAAHKPRPA